jgi:NAD-dependent SIR2 family protein deacetylase
MADINVITQNVDGLHCCTEQDWDWSNRLIEAHGRMGLYKCIPEEDSDTDSESDEEEDRPVKLGHRKKTRLLREAYFSYGDGAEQEEDGPGDGNMAATKKSANGGSGSPLKDPFDDWERKRKEQAEKAAQYRPKVSLLGGGVYMGVPISKASASNSSSNSSYSSDSEVSIKGRDCTKKTAAAASHSNTPDSKSSKGRTHNHVICRYELEESFPASLIEGTKRTRRIMLGGIPSDEEEDVDSTAVRRLTSEESASSDTGVSSGIGSETETENEMSTVPKKPRRMSHPNKPKRRRRRRSPKKRTFKLLEPPQCPECMIPCMPQALLFDEGYHAHDYYQFERMEDWLAKADAIIFVGTSFQVTITDVALNHARDNGVPVYNFNVDAKGNGSLESTSRLNAENIIGDVGETLPMLWIACQEEMGARGLFDELGEMK